MIGRFALSSSVDVRFTLCSSVDVRFRLNSESLILQIVIGGPITITHVKKLQMLANNNNIKLLNDQ
jgi:hypothetical protein